MTKEELYRVVETISTRALEKLKATQTPPYPAYYRQAFMDAANDISDEQFQEIFAQQKRSEESVQLQELLDETTQVAKESINEYTTSTHNVKAIASEQKNILDLATVKPEEGSTEVADILSDLMGCHSNLEREVKRAETRIAELELELEKAEMAASRDPVTRLPNAKMLDHHLTRILEVGEARNLDLFVLYVGINDFDAVNDQFGYVVGEKVLIFLAKTLQNSLRAENRVFKYDQNIFTVVLNRSDREEAEAVANRIKQRVEVSKLIYSEKIINITVSIGVVPHKEGDTLQTIKERSLKTLEAAQADGQGNVVIAEES